MPQPTNPTPPIVPAAPGFVPLPAPVPVPVPVPVPPVPPVTMPPFSAVPPVPIIVPPAPMMPFPIPVNTATNDSTIKKESDDETEKNS